MDNQIIYNLSNIPGFTEYVKTGVVSPEYEKFYSTKESNNYSIVSYKKDYLCVDLIDVYGVLRSVIFNKSKIVCFSPPKSLPCEEFMKEYPEKNDDIIVEEFVEGTMINVFFDGEWQIATRNNVGANVSFYISSSKTFRQMFEESCLKANIEINKLNPSHCYSFVLQHPENRIVLPVKNPRIYLTNVYKIQQDANEIRVLEVNLLEEIRHSFSHIHELCFPYRYEFTTYSDLINKFGSRNTPYEVMGIIIKNKKTGERTKIRNPVYEEIRHLRGNQPKLQYQYLCLRQSGKLSEFLKYYPETKEDMSMFRDQLHMFTDNLHKNYISCYVKKEQSLRLYPEQYRTHMFKLHEHFISDLRPKGLYVTNTVVIKYVNNLPPSLLMYCLNYNMRKRMIDKIKVDAEP